MTDKVDGRLAEFATATEDSTIFVINRDKFVPVLFIRNAKVEDNDDIRKVSTRDIFLTPTLSAFEILLQ